MEDLDGGQRRLVVQDRADARLERCTLIGAADAAAADLGCGVDRPDGRLLGDAGDGALGDARLSGHVAVAQA